MNKTYMYTGAAIFFRSSLATVSKLLLNMLNSYQVLMCSAFFAAAALLATNIFTGELKLLKEYRMKDYMTMVLISLPGTFLYYVFLYSATARMAAPLAFIINYSWPIMSVAFACLILKEKRTVRKGVAFAMSFLGVFTVAGEKCCM